jgi:hypothetical protein
MSVILGLYPRAWRARYGDELEALLEERPATLLDYLDLIRGAIDARLHPQVPGTVVRPERETPMNTRLLGAVAAIGGTVWLLGIVSLFVLPRDAEGYRDSSLAFLGFAIGLTLTGIALGELGSRDGSASSARTGHIITIASLALGGLGLMPWPIFTIQLFAFPALAFVAALRASKNGVMPAWLAPMFGAAGLASIAGLLGSIDGDLQLLLIASTGLAALVLAWVALTGRTAEPPSVSAA